MTAAISRAASERYGRHSARLAVRVAGVEGVLTSLSESGIFVETGAPLSAGEEVTVALADAPFCSPVRADVRYRRAQAGGVAGVALQFLLFTPAERARVAAFVAAAFEASAAVVERAAPPESGVVPAAPALAASAKVLPFRPRRAANG